MLPEPTQQRFLDAMPNTVDIRLPAIGETRRYTFQTWWADEDHDVVYPSIVCTLDPRGILRAEDQPFDDTLATVLNADSTVAHDRLRGHRLYDGLAVTAVDRGVSDGLEAETRASMMAGKIAKWMRLEVPTSQLTEPGGYNELPIHLPPTEIDGPADRSGMVDDTAVARFEVSARIYYTLATRDEIPATEETDVGWVDE